MPGAAGSEKKISLIVKAETSKVNIVDGIEIDEHRLISKREFKKTSIEEVRNSLPDVISVQENFMMKN